MKYFLFCLLFTSMFGCALSQKDKTAAADPVAADMSDTAATAPLHDQDAITCEGIGPVTFAMSEADLVARFGQARVARDSAFAEGQFVALQTAVFPGTTRQVIVRWQEENPPFRTASSLVVQNGKSPYRFANGIGMGTTVQELVQLNGGAAIRFGGMGWDYGGGFNGFDAGRLQAEMPCFGAVFDMVTTEFPDADALMGEKSIRSDTLTVAQCSAVAVHEIILSHPE